MTIFKESGTAILGCLVALGLTSGQVMAQDDAEMAKRLAPVGKLCVEGEKCQTSVPELVKEAPAAASNADTGEDATTSSTDAPADGEATASADAKEASTNTKESDTVDKQAAADEPAGDSESAAETASIDGQAIYQQTCLACHDTGIAGAPVRGDAKAWEPRLAQGTETLYEHAIKGFNIMPPKGGNTALSDDEVKAAVDYMVQ